MIKFRCPSCNRKAGVPTEYAGRKVKCPHCDAAIGVPNVTAEQRHAPQPQSEIDEFAALSASNAFNEPQSTTPRVRSPRRRKQKSNPAIIIGAVIGMAAIMIIVLVVALNMSSQPTPDTPDNAVADASSGPDVTSSADDDTPAQPHKMTPVGGTAPPPAGTAPPPAPAPPTPPSGSGKVTIAGIEFDASGRPLNQPKAAGTVKRKVPGFDERFDQFEEKTTLTSRPALMAQTAGGPGTCRIGYSLTFEGTEVGDADKVLLFIEIIASGTKWQDNEPTPAIGLNILAGGVELDLPVEHKSNADRISGQPTERLQYLISRQQLEKLAAATSGKATINDMIFDLSAQHFAACAQLVKYLGP